ncbi:MAG: S-layer homology domain-containing protein, partial [Candidatus Gracilibacteria bacterium]
MPSLKRILFQSLLTFALFFLLGAGAASAASLYAVTETTATVGTNAALEIEYTVDTGEQTWADADTLTLTLPANFPDWSALTFTVENDGDATNDGVNETAITVGAGNGQYAIAGKVMTIKWNLTGWGAVADDLETIRFLITAANIPTYANASSTFTFTGTTAAADTNPSGSDTVNVSADALTATNVDPYIFTQNSLTTSIVYLTTTVQIPSGGKIAVTYPSGYDVLLADGKTAQRPSGIDGTWNVAVSGQVMTLTQTGGSATNAGALSFEVTEIKNPELTGTTGTYTITTKDSSGNSLETDAAVAGDVIGKASSVSAVIGIPADLTITDASDGNGVVVTWTDPDDDSTAIQILRGISPIPVAGTPVTEIPVGLETYTDTSVELGDIVTYQLRATDGSEVGDLTDEVTFTVGSGSTAVDDTTDDDTGTGDDTTDDTSGDEDTGTGDDTTDDTSDDEDTGTDEVTLTDISGHWAATEIEAMTAAGVVEGNPDGSFNPDGNLNRAEAAALLWRVLGAGEPGETIENPFSDVDMNEWYAPYIARLKNLELVEGNPDGTYQPSEEINRAEFLQLAMNVYEYLNGDLLDPEEMTDA